jgi:Cu/Ag efflux protein CusF
MKRFGTAGMALAIGLALSGAAALAQTKEVPGERTTHTGTVEAIDHQARTLTLKQPSGEMVTLDIPKSVTRFDSMKVGDKVTAVYYDNVVVRKKPAGEAPVNTLTSAVTSKEGAKPGGTLGNQRTMTATVEAIDLSVPSITFTGPNGWKYSRRVEDKGALKDVKVGDQVDFTWSEAVQITVDAPK